MYHHVVHKTLAPVIHPSKPNKSNLLRVGMNQLNCVQMDGGGVDSDGREFKSAEECGGKRWGTATPQEISVVFAGRRLLAGKLPTLYFLFFIFRFQTRKVSYA